MSIKKLFESNNKVQEFVSDVSSKDLFNEDGESFRNVEAIREDQKRYVPQIDYSKPENFARYGSARLYYKSALSRITDYYPYDGSEAEISEFLNGCLDVERYILDNEYPRTTGYITLGLGSTYNGTITDGYGAASSFEHIDFVGGPGTGSVSSSNIKDLVPDPLNSKHSYSNIYDESIYTTAGLPTDYGSGTRTSNLKSNLDEGVTVEFWMKTGSLNPANQTSKQVIFDMWNQLPLTESAHSRFMIELTSSHAATGDAQRPFLITVQSGTHTTKDFLSLGQAVLHSSSGDWNHYAIRVFNTGSNLKAQLYVNGYLNDSALRQPYDLASTTLGLLSNAYQTTTPSQERSWPHAIENDYSSATQLQGWWRLNNSSSATLRVDDMSGRGRNGTFLSASEFPTINTTTYPSVYVQQTTGSVTFDGANNKINIGTADTWNAIIGNNRPTDDGVDHDGDGVADDARGMSFTAWIRPTGKGENNFGRIIDFGHSDITFYIGHSSGDPRLLFAAKWNSGDSAIWQTTQTITLNSWQHVAVTYDAGKTSNNPILYINGVAYAVTQVGTAPSNNFDGIAGDACYIGNRSAANRTFAGQIADVGVWDSVLLANEIKSIYSAVTIKSTTHTVGELGPADLRARIGALQTKPPGSSATAKTGRLSGSLDEFRFWKTKRSSREIGTNWLGQVRGGANTDISNTTLGVYYKFNEGITGNSNTDSVVLDYAGRVTNATWTGYTAASRNTGSAIVSASAATKEYLDPIIRTNHPSYINLQSRLLDSGTYHDYQNNTSVLNLVPSWIVQKDDEDNNTDLRYITHVMGAYFDKLYLQISELPKLRHQTHTSGTFKPISFAEHLPQSLGLYSPEIFIDSTILEKFMNRSDKIVFEDELNDAKNMIYQNLYNNLTEIYKAKGTEQAIKNVLKCFNIDDKLLKLRVNSNNAELVLKNNLEQHLIKKNLLDFSKQTHNSAVVYQKRETNVLSGIDTDVVAGCITGSTSQYGYGFTYEANVVFPEYDALNTVNTKLRPNFTQMSLFGTVTTDGNITSSSFGTDTTATGNSQDYGNFKVYFVREEQESKSGYFKLVVANPGSSAITLTSSVFNDVYNNELWNLSVRVKPENYPLDTFVHPFTGSYKYDIIFSGYNSKTTDLFNSFKVSTQVAKSIGQKYTESGKRAYVGADKINVTGDVSYFSDVQISSVAFWTKYLQDTDLQQHALDLENIGLSGSIQYLNGLDTNNRYSESLNHKTLALNWNFRNLTGSDSAGNFVVQDFSSGSQTDRNDYGWVGKLTGRYHTGYGAGFPVSSTNVVNAKRLNSYRFVDPERPVSSDMIQIFTDEDDLSPNLRREEILPNFVYSLEKSLYEAISQEMLDFFAGVIDFNDVIGHPVHYYRHRYKELEKLRQIFFHRVTKVTEVEKYTEYYKWFDDAITTIISQLVPASSEYINDIQNVIESHVLERNKYQNRLNIFDGDKFSIERVLPEGAPLAASPTFPGDADYVAASTSKESSPRPTNTHIAFWKTRADRSSAEITSGDPIVDAQRNKFRDVIYSNPVNSGAAAPPTLRKLDGTKYQPSNYGRKTQGYPLTLNVQMQDVHQGKNLNNARILTRDIRGGVNFESAKNFDFAASITRPGGPINHEGGKIVPLNVMVGFVGDATQIPVFRDATKPSDVITKKKQIFKVQTGRDWEEGLGYKNVKSTMAFPFNVYSASVEVNSGYNAEVVSRVTSSLMITNVHNDVYGDHAEIPMQGPFTDHLVGGHQSRHVDLNAGTDQQNNRPEAWRILLGTCAGIVPSGAIGVVGPDYPPANYNPPAGTIPYPYPYHEKAYLYRDHIAKRPVNIRNVNTLQNNKTVPGNFQEQYEVVHSFGAFNNARAFLDNQPTLPSQLADVKFTTNVRSIFDIKRTANSHVDFVGDYSTAYLNSTVNKTIVTTKFAAPGGIEVMSKGYLDFKSGEMTPYNSLAYRNQTVIKPQQGPSGTISEPVVYGGATNIQVSDIHGKDYGLRAHLARHSARFGRDSLFVASPGTSVSELPSFHKINRNSRQVIKATNENNSTFVTSSRFDNAFVVRPIPQSDRQYRWFSGSVVDVNNIKYAGYQNVNRGERYNAYRTSSAGIEFYWTFVSASDATTGSLYQPSTELNIIINDPIDASTHTLGFPRTSDVSNYTNTDLVGNAPNPDYLNQLLTSRKDKFGWGWRKFHQHNNRLLVSDRRANRLVIATGSDRTLSTHELRPISMKGRQSYINFDITVAGPQLKSGNRRENATLKFTNTNEKIFFNDLDLNNYFNLDYDLVNEPYRDAVRMAKSPGSNLNWFLYKQNLFPSLKNEFGAFSSKRVGYDNKFWRDSRADRTTIGNTLSSSLVGVPVSKSCWVLDAPENFLTRTFISGTRGSEMYNFNDSYFVQQPFVALTGVLAHNQNVPKAGVLQNTYFSYYNIATDGGRLAMVTPAPLYARKHELGSPMSVVSPAGVRIAETGSFSGLFNTTQQIPPFAGEALWEAGTQAGIVAKVTSAPGRKSLTSTQSASVFLPSASNPWYNDYDDFNSELKLISKGYAVVPEYRMSEHVKDYFNYGVNNKTKTNFLEIVGTNSSSANRNFYIDYSNSDFLENFLGIKNTTLLNAKEIKLTCNAAIKYNPYDGFYPAQRTVDLATQFIDSFKDAFQGGYSGSSDGVSTVTNKAFGGNLTILERAGGISKLLLDPLVSPGILYNSIKSGIAVDYPIISNTRKRLRRFYGTNDSGSTNNWALTITGAATEDMIVSGTGQYLQGQYWDKRIPFEAIIEPRKYILNTNFIEMETHPSMSLDFSWNHYGPGLSGLDDAYEKESFTGSFSNNADGVYTLMARNFFGACGEFFLQSSGITKLESNTVLNDLQFAKDDNFANGRPLYMARIKLRKSHNGARTYDKEFDSFNTQGALGYYGINGAKRTTNGTQSVGEYALPQDPMHNSLFKETFTMYSRPTAFGPSCAGRPTGSNGAIAPFLSASKDSFSGFNPAFTPPYYDGEAWADLIFRPHVIDKSQVSTATPEVYDLNRILNETTVVCWRFDSGEEKQDGSSALTASMPVLIPIEKKQISNFSGVTPNNDNTVPSIYDGKRINVNSMQLTSSIKIFGTEKVLEQETDKFGAVVKNSNKPVGTKWIIQPKWETPMLNFNDEGIHGITAAKGNLTLPTYGSASVPRGMWHQFGIIPDDPNVGVFLEISDIPEDWLRNHYEVLTGDRETPYNGNAIPSNLLDAQSASKQNTRRVNLYKNVRSLSSLCGFDQTNSSIKLGQLKDSVAVHEAIVAIPYVIEEIEENTRKALPTNSKLRKRRKKFISIPKRRFAATREQAAGSAQGDSLGTAGESLRKLKQSLEKYVFPPEFDFLNNKEVDPIAMYVFEFKYEFDRDDLSYIWQNLAPRDSKEIKLQKSSIAHNLANNELINEEVLMNDNLRWMVFKVKQRAQTDYYDLIPDQANESTRQVRQRSNKLKEYKFGFNWPYDYLSFVELIKMDVDILLKE